MTGKSAKPTLTQRTAAAELTLADLHALVQAQIVAAEAMKTAGQCNTDNIAAINTALDKLSASHEELAQSHKTMETNLTNQLSTSHDELSQANKKMDSTLSRLITSTTALDSSVAHLKQSVDTVAQRVQRLEQSPPPPSTALRDAHLRTGLLRPNEHGSATLHQGHNCRVIQTSDCPLVRGENSNSGASIHTDFNHEFEPPDSPGHDNHHH